MSLLRHLKLFSCADEGARVTLVGAALDTLIGLLKLLAGLLGHSSALVADGLHSLSDAASDLVVVVAHNLSQRAPSERFAYGFQRAETLGVLFIGLLLLGFALGLAGQSALTLWRGAEPVAPGLLTIGLAVVCLLVKEAYYHVSLAVGRRLESQLLIANAQHSRTDVYTSLLVVAGLLAVSSGWYWLDPLMALFIAGMVLRVALGFLVDAVSELMEANLPDEERARVINSLRSVPGVLGCHELRGRRVGRSYLLECHVEVDATCSVSEGHQIGAAAADCVRGHCDMVRDISVHIDPQGLQDGHLEPLPWPGRAEVLQTFRGLCADLSLQVDSVRTRLHYTDSGLQVDLVCQLQGSAEPRLPGELQHRLQSLVEREVWLDAVHPAFIPAPAGANRRVVYLAAEREMRG
ncbi:cation diffusion facilitator family transporter [Parahaliea maris]|uniref:cation diffusion facilitator family transporter n=1 Tax=Parahaliea maris TaxID=2716870 RepID=UPI001650B24E|nr:cation diffusion facilitator family transporter [Parahaliea maris]